MNNKRIKKAKIKKLSPSLIRKDAFLTDRMHHGSHVYTKTLKPTRYTTEKLRALRAAKGIGNVRKIIATI